MPMSFAGPYVRRRTTERMEDACIVFRPSTAIEVDPVTRKAKRARGQVKYEGRCRIWEVQAGAQSDLAGHQVVIVNTFMSLPYDSPVAESDDIVEVTQSVDDSLVGRTLQIVSLMRGGGLRPSRRYLVRFVDSQKEAW